MLAPRAGVGVVECFDPVCGNGWLVAETGERRPFRIRCDMAWIPRVGQEVVFDRALNDRGLYAVRVAPLRTYEPAPAPLGGG
jgi:hypothetical protein